ncbi:hypothetical protein H7142_02725 [Candidatus Saccharibacteria bacterium]|nr:hypothetical protein [Candidatus Saccharibacteria bacterium]
MLRTVIAITALAVAAKLAKEIVEFIMLDNCNSLERHIRKFPDYVDRDLKHLTHDQREQFTEGPILVTGHDFFVRPRPSSE